MVFLMEYGNQSSEKDTSAGSLKGSADTRDESGSSTIVGAGPSRMAEGIALHRLGESMLPEDIRIFCDPYAIYFIDPRTLEWAKAHPQEAQAGADELERMMPGWSNSIRARVRYFDDVVHRAVDDGYRQLVVLGAGYDSRAYRIEEVPGRALVFEVDRSDTLDMKKRIITRIFGSLPGHVEYVPADLGTDNLWENLDRNGYSRERKTLFIMEGFVMYLPLDEVRELFSGIMTNSAAGSTILFDFIPQFMVDGISDQEGSQNIRAYTISVGEPLRSGFQEGIAEVFLSGLGYSDIVIVTSKTYRELYFSGKNSERLVSSLMSFASASVPDRSGTL
jgi:methyltransferase (TIGR00027 family)